MLAFQHWSTTVLVVLLVQLAFGIIDTKDENVREILRLAKAAEMKAYMNSNADPCTDFYAYACGNWSRINPTTDEDPATNVFDNLSAGHQRWLVKILSTPLHSNDTEMDRKVKYFYQSCLNARDVQQNYRKAVQRVTAEFGGLPFLMGAQWQEDQFDWQDVVARVLKKYGTQTLFALEVFGDIVNNNITRLYIGQFERMTPAKEEDYYYLHSMRVMYDLHTNLGQPMSHASKTAHEIVNFQKELAMGYADPVDGLGLQDLSHLRLLSELTDSYGPTLNWTHIISSWLGYEYLLPVYEFNDGYMRNLKRVMETTPKRVVANYILWKLAHEFMLDVTEDNTATKCAAATKRYFIRYTERLMFQRITQQNPNILPDLREIWVELKDAFGRAFNSSTANWLTNTTRKHALEKLATLDLIMNDYEWEDFSKRYGDIDVSTDDYFGNVQRILEARGRVHRLKILEPPELLSDENTAMIGYTPAYMPERNKVIISAGFLQPYYLWHESYPAALKFATVGYVIGHEMAHAFDDTGRKFDEKGNFNSWFDRKSLIEYEKRRECIRNQYSKFEYVGEKYGLRTAQGENIADNIGFRIAYDAYLSWLMRKENADRLKWETLPQMELTGQQLFFLSCAQLWCVELHPQIKGSFAKTDVHAPGELRVVGTASNFAQFAQEYNCSADSEMNPPTKCIVL